MFWTIIGALFFFFYVLPVVIRLIGVIVIQDWFWKLVRKFFSILLFIILIIAIVSGFNLLINDDNDLGGYIALISGYFLFALLKEFFSGNKKVKVKKEKKL